MVSMLKMPRRWEDGSYNFGFGGLSTDEKPTKTWDEYAIANGSSFFEIDTLNLYFYDKDTDAWIKAKVEAGGHAITADNVTATATVDDTTGTPAVKVTKSADGNDVNFSFAFSGLKGATGEKGEKGEKGRTDATVTLDDLGYTATVDDTTGTPDVKVSTESTDSGTFVNFAFTGLKGEKGDKGDKGTDGTGASGATITAVDTGQSNTVKEAGAAIGHGNTVEYASLAVGHMNKAVGTDAAALGNRVVADTNQVVVGQKFAGLTQWQDQFTFHSGDAFAFIAAANSDETSHDFLFAVPRTYNDDGGIIIQGKNGASKAYYLLKIIGGNLSITDITSKIKFEAGS